jgi:hypothetical protein
MVVRKSLQFWPAVKAVNFQTSHSLCRFGIYSLLAYFGPPLHFAAHFMAEHKDRDKHSIMLEGKK